MNTCCESLPEPDGGAPVLSIVVPLFNEEQNVARVYRRLVDALEAEGATFELVFVNDGSGDTTGALLDGLQSQDGRVVVVHLSRNFGHQPAVSAGLDHARSQAVVVMDGDLQDPPEVLGQFIRLWREGYEVVYAVRTKRKEGPFKRLGYYLFYRILHAISDLDIPLDSGDFCLMDRRVVDSLRALPEHLRFVRGLRTFVGFRQIGLAYERAAREAGESKYPFRKLLGLAIDGLVSFSSYPLRLVSYLGFGTIVLAMVLIGWVVIDYFANHTAPAGWASTVVVVLVMSAIQLLSLGIMGEYVRRIFLEVKGRPTYIVREVKQGTASATPTRLIRPSRQLVVTSVSENGAGVSSIGDAP
jgi:dolichol-phosphate mannosyltransferase